jgi:hypothetical protein
MTLRHSYALYCAFLLTSAAGCSHFADATPNSQDVLAAEWLLAPAARGSLKLDIRQLPDIAYRDPSPAPDAAFRALTEEQAQCLASANSSKANFLDQQARELEEKRPSLGEMLLHLLADRELRAEVLRSLALEDRNQTAGTALQHYFRLIETEAKADLARRSIALMQPGLAELAKMRDGGLKVPAELDGLEAQEAQMRADLVRLEAGITSLNDSLAQLLGMPGCCRGWRFWPAVDLAIKPDVPDVRSALHVAHQHRPALLLNQKMQAEATSATSGAARMALQSAYGVASPDSSDRTSRPGHLLDVAIQFIHHESKSPGDSLAVLGRQTERQVEDEVCQALNELQRQVQLIGIVRSRLMRQEQRLADLENKLAQGLISPMSLSAPRLEAIKLEADLIQEVAGWHIARVKLKQAQGLLVAECHDHAACLRLEVGLTSTYYTELLSRPAALPTGAGTAPSESER